MYIRIIFVTRKFAVLVSFLFVVICSQAQNIKGKITDASTGDALIGATVYLKGTSSITQVRLDGTYVLNNLKPGIYELRFLNKEEIQNLNI